MIALHLIIRGRVQGVGYRDWLVWEAQVSELDGWVRNRADGSVEALLAGPEYAVDGVLSACHEGPPSASVTGIETTRAEVPPEKGFRRLPTL